LRETSGGTEIAAPPTRDCVGEVVENDCVREKAGARKIGKEPCLRGLRDSCLKQLCVMEQDMVVIEVCCLKTTTEPPMPTLILAGDLPS
jgi:hypothetical protein